ncbi:acylphosphatase [Roseibium salinum]|uniref:acylphosphatase n=1 Tax=Roseibium salinum TaxID=1604349 RepID=A0ABT3QZZ9_9HYPH|nr:acylphosphatase [Roseibium sp. DSM 29163]MCX2722423.1 acylphosphatase [Roseibium sp. DSM 29163]MDN3719600.1 acylphosphatase [Roseibium salinum]
MTTDPLTVHVLIEGRVQGVGYRAWCAEEAEARDLSGWVRNLESGAVEAVFTGPSDTVVDMLDALWMGPSLARVNLIKDLDATEPARGPFEVRDIG